MSMASGRDHASGHAAAKRRTPAAGGRSALRRLVLLALGSSLALAASCSSDATAPVAAGASGTTGVTSPNDVAGRASGVAGRASGVAGRASGGDGGGAVNIAGTAGLVAGAAGSISGVGGDAGTGETPIKAMWKMDAGKYALTLGSTYLEVDPAYGARVTALRVGGSTGVNLLADATVTEQVDNWGSTFWPSPQNWPWPPTGANSIAAINSESYVAVSDTTSLTLTSAQNPVAPALTVVKKFSADVRKQAIVIEYTMTNGGTTPVTVAPWEITRVPPGGITFYAAASPPVYHATPPLPTMDAAGVTWYQHDASDTGEYKLFADGKEGWIAHAAGDLLLIKSFPDIPASASPKGEAEIEIYAVQKYVEMETQGAVATLSAGQALHWTVRWYARKLTTLAAVGSAELVRYVRKQIE